MPLLSTSGAAAAKGFGMFIDPMAKYFLVVLVLVEGMVVLLTVLLL